MLCHGRGQEIKDPCTTLSWNWVMKNKLQSVNVKIPAGVERVNKIRLAGQGEAGFGTVDLMVTCMSLSMLSRAIALNEMVQPSTTS